MLRLMNSQGAVFENNEVHVDRPDGVVSGPICENTGYELCIEQGSPLSISFNCISRDPHDKGCDKSNPGGGKACAKPGYGWDIHVWSSRGMFGILQNIVGIRNTMYCFERC